MKIHTFRAIHKNSEGKIMKRNNPLTTTEYYYCCISNCGFSSTEYDALIEHFKQKHRKKHHNNTKFQGKLVFKCPVCAKGFEHRSALMKHQFQRKYFFCKPCDTMNPISARSLHAVCQDLALSPEEVLKSTSEEVSESTQNNEPKKPIKSVCHICGKLVKHLEDHMAMHENKRTWECGICEARFNRYSIVLNHQRIHTENRDYKCRHGCEKSYKAHGDRDRHEKLVHLGIRPFACDYCPAAFVRERDLRLHNRKHTGKKLFHCNRCGAGFNKKAEFDQHEEQCGRSKNVDDC